MRFAGKIEPGSGVGGSGQFANCRRPNATAEANAAESCLLRPGMSCGVIVSEPAATWGGTTTGFLITESVSLLAGGGADPGRASLATHETTIETANKLSARRIRSGRALLFGIIQT
jgi:hypothetical protein